MLTEVDQEHCHQAVIALVPCAILAHTILSCRHRGIRSALTLGWRLYFRFPPVVTRDVALIPDCLSSVVNDPSMLIRPFVGFWTVSTTAIERAPSRRYSAMALWRIYIALCQPGWRIGFHAGRYKPFDDPALHPVRPFMFVNFGSLLIGRRRHAHVLLRDICQDLPRVEGLADKPIMVLCKTKAFQRFPKLAYSHSGCIVRCIMPVHHALQYGCVVGARAAPQ